VTIQVLVVSPFPTVRAGLRALLAETPEIEILGEAAGTAEIEGSWRRRPHVALVDGSAGAAVVKALETAAPETGIILLGAEPPRSREAWGPAARGYLGHDANADEIAAAVRAVASGLAVIEPALIRGLLGGQAAAVTGSSAAGDESLTPREIEVLQLVAAGLPNKTIAARLNISEHTAKFHVSSVLSKLGAASRTEAVITAARQGLLLL
jgi:DNA-binding NarL/FixJ family response regulator